ncbi:MAG TPA: DUF6798 domain-containing protein [Kofleriaceae bacterium]|nr:DUF6798 domain-containing protein [Kofleriaceae bacterium]
MTRPELVKARWRSGLVIAVVIAVAVVFAVAYGNVFGTKNQLTYLLDGLVRARPDLYRNDWFVTQNHHYHVAFAYLTAPLFELDPDGAIAFGIAQLVAMVATFAAIYGLVAAATSRGRLIVFVGIVGLLALGGGHALGGTYLYAGYLQPSALATIGWLVAINAWVRDRLVIAGIALALGGVFHLNYAVLGVGAFGLCELAVQRRCDVRRMASLLGPSLVVLIVFLPMLVASSKTSNGKLAMDVLVQFEFPGHFKPSRLRLELFALVGWQLIALSLRPQDREPLTWFALITMTSVIVAVVLVQIGPLLSVTRLFAWRIAPFGILVAQIQLFVATREIAQRERPRPRGWQLVGLVVGASLVVYNAFTRPREPYPEVVTCLMVACALTIAVRRELIANVMCGGLCAFALWSERSLIAAPVLFENAEGGLTKWARTESPRDAVFLIPPYYGDFRLLARRAVVVDDKSPPMYLDELVEWYQRLCSAVDAKKLDSLGDGWQRWNTLSPERLVAVADRFHASYIVLDKAQNASRLTAPIAYEDGFNVVYALGH